MYKQKLGKILFNPFYCGIISNKMSDGKLVEGRHEKLISQKTFLMVNQIRTDKVRQYGVSHLKAHEPVPLKVFMKCDKCGNAYTGYIAKSRNIW